MHIRGTCAGIGTHLDAPSHCVPSGKATDEIPLEKCIAPCIVHATYKVTMEDVRCFESQYGAIRESSVVMVRTGWDRFWKTPDLSTMRITFPR